MTSKTAVANLALSHLGQGVEIQNLETTRSPEATAIRTVFDTLKETVLRDYPWTFAHKIQELGLVSSLGDDDHPTDEWNYAYRMPSDCLMFRKIQSGTRNDTRQSKVSYKISRDSQGQLIFTDMPDAVGEWTISIDEVERWPSDFVLALSYLIASIVAPKICGQDPFKLGDKALRNYSMQIVRAQNNSANEQQDEEQPEAEGVRARE